MTIGTSSTQTPVEQVVLPSLRTFSDGFQVRRALPAVQRGMVGPFIFFDGFGPVVLRAGEGVDTRPHPHIGLATLTYLIEGEIIHRDSIGEVQAIRPGAVNLMTAGSGIVHSERSSPPFRAKGGTLFGFQSWVALPTAHEETPPDFQHHPAETLPLLTGEGKRLHLLAGIFAGQQAPTRTLSDVLYADVQLDSAAHLQIPTEHTERAIYIISGTITVAGQTGSFGADRLVVLKPGAEILLQAQAPARLILLGGEPFPEKRHLFWNFVSSSPDRIQQAKRDWRTGRFPPVPGETEFIPLPEE